jgi:hypothetical protein
MEYADGEVLYKPRYSIPGYHKSEVRKERCHKKKIF